MKHKKVVANLQARQRWFDSLSVDKQKGNKRPGSMSGRK